MNRLLRLCFVELIAACLAIAFLHAPGTFDDFAFVLWAKTLNAAGPFAGYAVVARSYLDYPPIGLLLMWLPIHLAVLFNVSDLLSFKLSLAIFTLLSAQIVLFRARPPEEALLLMLVATPFGLILGYTDIMYLPFLLTALYAAESGEFAMAGFALALATLVKFQPFILTPLFLLAAFQQRRSLRQFARVLAPTLILVLAICLLFGAKTMFNAFLAATQVDYLSGQGANAAWLISYALELLHWHGLALQPDGAIAIIQPSQSAAPIGDIMGVLRALFYLLFAVSLGIYGFGRKTPQAFLIGALACAMTQFTWNNGVHENHFFVPMVAGFVCWQAKIIDHCLFAGLAVVAVLNIILFYGFDGFFNFTIIAGTDPTALLAAAEILLYVMVLDLQVRTSLGGWGAATSRGAGLLRARQPA